jgi:hypothetical protein
MQILWGKGVFTKEIEDALPAYEIDVAVHLLQQGAGRIFGHASASAETRGNQVRVKK